MNDTYEEQVIEIMKGSIETACEEGTAGGSAEKDMAIKKSML